MCFDTKLPASRAAPWAQHSPTSQLYPLHGHGSSRQLHRQECCGQSSLLVFRTLPPSCLTGMGAQGQGGVARLSMGRGSLPAVPSSMPPRAASRCPGTPLPWGQEPRNLAGEVVPSPHWLGRGPFHTMRNAREPWSSAGNTRLSHRLQTRDRYLGKPQPSWGIRALAGSWDGRGVGQKGAMIWCVSNLAPGKPLWGTEIPHGATCTFSKELQPG